MSVRENLLHPIETFRTAPLRLTGCAVGVGEMALGGALIDDHPVIGGLTMGVGVLTTLVNGDKTRFLFKLRHRTEGLLERGGFRDAIFDEYDNKWCAYQAGRVACQRTGHLEEFDAYADTLVDRQFPRLPLI